MEIEMASGGNLIELHTTPEELRAAADAIEIGAKYPVEARDLVIDEAVDVIFSPRMVDNS